MRITLRMAFFLFLSVVMVGCNGDTTSSEATRSDSRQDANESGSVVANANGSASAFTPRTVESPVDLQQDPVAGLTGAFMDACCRGDGQRMTTLLSPAAKTQVAEYAEGLDMGAIGANSFVVKQVNYIAADGARVTVDLTNVDEETGQPITDSILVMARLTNNQWGIAGMALEPLGRGTGSLIIDFEDMPTTIEQMTQFRQLAEQLALQQQAEMQQSGEPGVEEPAQGRPQMQPGQMQQQVMQQPQQPVMDAQMPEDLRPGYEPQGNQPRPLLGTNQPLRPSNPIQPPPSQSVPYQATQPSGNVLR